VNVTGHSAVVELPGIPTDIDRVVVAAVQDDDDPTPLSARPLQVTVDPGGLDVAVSGLTSERAVVLVEVYRRNRQWKIRNVSAGWTEGFSALVRAHGVEVDEEIDAEPAAAAAPTIDLRKSGVDAVDLGKRTGAINLRKGQQVTITKTQRIVATCTWPRATDYDIFALVRYRDGHDETVSTFGTEEVRTDFQLVTRDGAVRHSGDVGRQQQQSSGWRKKKTAVTQEGRETIQITLNADILAVLPVVYSAQSNGGGSFREYQVSMAIDNGGGDTVTIDAGNASDHDAVYSCVPGIIINDPDGVRIQFLELYSAPDSEQRPILGADLIVTMDAGATNAYK
jgi:tellurite resistance protein TerA